jgi:cytochrome b
MSPEAQIIQNSQNSSKVYVWDLPVRLFHWILVALMIALMVTGKLLDDAVELHATLGRVSLALVLFRLMWGVVGSSYARFSQFIRGPRVVIAYGRSLFSKKTDFIIGHNPLGGWMVLVLLAAVCIQSVLGLFSNDDVLFDGPLAYMVSKETSDYLTGLHVDLFNALLLLIGLHVAAVVWHKLFMGENLLTAMFTGYKMLPFGVEAKNNSGGGALLAVMLLVINALVVYWLTQ